MSRTYRLRNLPALPGHAKKFVDSRVRNYRREEEDVYWHRLAHEILGYPCLVGTSKRKHSFSFWGQHYQCIPWRAIDHNEKDRLFKLVQADRIYDVGPIHDHPWVSWGIAQNKLKSYYKTTGNRKARRGTRQQLNHPGYDAEQDFLPISGETWSTWDLW